MNLYRRFRRGFFVSLVLSFVLPIPLAYLSFYLLNKSIQDTSNPILTIVPVAVGIGVGMFIAMITFIRIARPLQDIYKHLEAVRSQNLEYRTKHKVGGMFGEIVKMLNTVTEKQQEYFNRSQTESDVIGSEANRLRYVINSINDGVLALDKDARIILFNKAAAKISGYEVAEAAGMPISQIAPMMRGYKLVINEWLDSNNGKPMADAHWEALRLKTKAGKERSVDVDALYQGADPNGIRTLITFHDRTQAQEIEDMKVDFVALAAHELRTPITVIRGYLEILENELGPTLNPEYKEYMRKLNISASQLSGFINNILHVSRIEHGNLNLKLEKTDWAQLVRNACEELSKKAALQEKKLTLSIADGIPSAAVDKTSIVEVVNNLVDNAIKYSPAGTSVDVSVSTNNNMIETTVLDHGVGIPENALGSLFTKFYRSHRTRSSHQGTGLGLYMSKGIIEAHGGSIWVRSKEGEGSTFGFLLPTYDKVAGSTQSVDNSNKITRGVHGWIKNHSLYRG